MKLKLVRISSQADSTSGVLFIDDEFACYTLEDEQREVKVYGETAIPLGTYDIKFRNVGGFHDRYKKRFTGLHVGMLELQDVPNFQFILIHCGNTDENTAGCILLGDSQENNLLMPDGFIGKSTQAYKRVYKQISDELVKGNKVTIEIVDINESDRKETTNKSSDDVILTKTINEQYKAINGKLAMILARVNGQNIE